jgi:hypothetical protein
MFLASPPERLSNSSNEPDLTGSITMYTQAWALASHGDLVRSGNEHPGCQTTPVGICSVLNEVSAGE